MEAEPQPVDLSKSISNSDLMNCDKDGAFLYKKTAQSQLDELAAQMGLDAADIIDKVTYQTTITPKEKTKTSIWGKLFTE